MEGFDPKAWEKTPPPETEDQKKARLAKNRANHAQRQFNNRIRNKIKKVGYPEPEADGEAVEEAELD